jgi:hypothetical protein
MIAGSGGGVRDIMGRKLCVCVSVRVVGISLSLQFGWNAPALPVSLSGATPSSICVSAAPEAGSLASYSALGMSWLIVAVVVVPFMRSRSRADSS